MADSADNPSPGGTDFSPAQPAAAAPARESFRAFLPSTTSPPESSTPYQPLSLAAIVGFAMALCYSLYVAGTSLFTFFSHDPLYLPLWTMLLPMAIVLVCAVARLIVAKSEGTLGGMKLANWGLGMTVVLALVYWAYHTATIVALRQQAVTVVRTKFLEPLQKGNTEEAFLMSMKPPRPTTNMRHFIEVDSGVNAQLSLKLPGKYTQFAHADFVRLLGMAGDRAKITLKSIGNPVLEKQVMQLPLIYHVETPLKTFDMQVLAYAFDGSYVDLPGRQWQIDLDRTSHLAQTDSLNEEGNLLLGKIEPTARLFISTWVNKVTSVLDTEGALRYTMTPEHRQKIIPKVKDKNEAELNKLVVKTNDPEIKQYLKDLEDFRNGNLVQAKKETFFVSEAARAEVIADAKKRFLSGYATITWLKLSGAIPLWKVEGDKFRFYYDVNIQLLPRFVGAGQLVVEADAIVLKDRSAPAPAGYSLAVDEPEQRVFIRTPSGQPEIETWRLAELDLTSASAAPKPGQTPKND